MMVPKNQRGIVRESVLDLDKTALVTKRVLPLLGMPIPDLKEFHFLQVERNHDHTSRLTVVFG